jgi:ABC-2 type transport system ATP-binding protein
LDTWREGNAVRRTVGYALAFERSFFPRLTVRENLDFFAALEDVPKREMRHRVESALTRANLSHAASEQAMKLSSGTYQRMGIARALLKNPSVLLLDEPSRSLDLASSESLWDLVREVSASRITVVLATHNFEEASAVCDRLALLHKGRLIDRQPCGASTPKQLREFYCEMTSEHDEQSLQELSA